MNKFLFAAFVLAAGLSVSAVSRAEDEDAPAPASTTPEAAAAARDKGYRAEEADKAPAPDEEEAAPVERHADKRPVAPPAQRPLAGGGANPKSSSGVGGASAAGISCEDSVPKLTSVQRKEIDLVKTFQGPVTHWSVGPNEAVVYKFKTPASGAGTFTSDMDTQSRSVASLQTVSQTPCDFDVEKARSYTHGGKGANLCYAWGPVTNGVVFVIGDGKGAGCALKPNTVYYYSIRALSNPDQPDLRDACEAERPFFKSRPELRYACGGIWKIFGSVPPAAK